MNRETMATHIGINLKSSIPFSKSYTIHVGLKDILDDLLQCHYPFLTTVKHLFVLQLVVTQEQHVDLCFQNLEVFGETYVLLHAADEPPTGIAAIVTGVDSEVKQVGDHPMA
jgi:hypothetical protein